MRTLIASVLLAVGAFQAEEKVAAQPQTSLSKNEFGQFAPRTDAERELEKMLRRKGEDIDLALATWLIVADLPQFTNYAREAYFKTLDEMTQQVRESIARMETVASSRGQKPKDPDVRCAIFANAIIKLRFTYAEQFSYENLTPAQMQGLYHDANNIFLAGLLRTRRGSCVSMPLIYLVIGQRLGMPVHLVTVGKHCFIRWEEPGYRMNIETTSVDKVRVTPDDTVYTDAEGLKPSELVGNQMRNLTRCEVVGNLFFARSAHWRTYRGEHETQSCMDIARARHLAPEDPGIKATQEGMYKAYGIRPEHTSIDIRIKPKAEKGDRK
jgi:regulator of sirC expression with transglutaminase-like and TPR domain